MISTKRINHSALGGTLALALTAFAACSNDTGTPAENTLLPNGSTTGTQGDSTRNAPSGNAIAGIRIVQGNISMPVSGAIGISVIPVDQNGIPSLALLASRPILSVGSTSVATVSNTDNILRGVAAGTTKLYAQVGALKDSVVVTVSAVRDTTKVGTPSTPTAPPRDTTRTDSTQTPNNPPSGPVANFTLSVYVFGRATPVSTRDTANVVQIAGANISIYRLSVDPSSPRDSLSVRTLVKTAVADGNGKAVISNLPSGYYSVDAKGSYQGAAMEGRIDFGPPRTADFATAIYLTRK